MYFPCQAAPPEQHGRFYVNELVCGLFAEDQQWYRAIVLDVGNSHDSCLDSLDPYVTLLLCNPEWSICYSYFDWSPMLFRNLTLTKYTIFLEYGQVSLNRGLITLSYLSWS